MSDSKEVPNDVDGASCPSRCSTGVWVLLSMDVGDVFYKLYRFPCLPPLNCKIWLKDTDAILFGNHPVRVIGHSWNELFPDVIEVKIEKWPFDDSWPNYKELRDDLLASGWHDFFDDGAWNAR